MEEPDLLVRLEVVEDVVVELCEHDSHEQQKEEEEIDPPARDLHEARSGGHLDASWKHGGRGKRQRSTRCDPVQ